MLCSAPKFHFGREIKQAFANTCTFSETIPLGSIINSVTLLFQFEHVIAVTRHCLVWFIDNFFKVFQKTHESISFGRLTKCKNSEWYRVVNWSEQGRNERLLNDKIYKSTFTFYDLSTIFQSARQYRSKNRKCILTNDSQPICENKNRADSAVCCSATDF